MTVQRHTSVRGVRVPTFLYGTAWKEDATCRLVELALGQGFRGIDTANQRKHYHEAGVGEALARAAVPREELFLQTKFTSVDGQDQRLPYDAKASVATQVRQSFESSLSHLGTDYVDSYVLHGPTRRDGLSPADWEAWGAMEVLAREGRTRLLGVSNFSDRQLQTLIDTAQIPPAFVQNRCYASRGWDSEVRKTCRQHGLCYQGFSLLTANADVLHSACVRELASRLGKTPEQIVFRFALQLGMLPLTGSSDPRHLREDLDVYLFELEEKDARRIETLAS